MGWQKLPRVLLLGEIELAENYFYEQLKGVAEVITTEASNRSEFIAECKNGNFDGVIACYRTYSSVKVSGRFDAELVAHLPKSWTFLCHVGAGYDQIDIPPCSNRTPPIRVSNVAGAVDDATADTAVFLLLGALRNFNPPMTSLRQGEWRGKPAAAMGHDPQGKLLGILGMGGIGRNMALKCQSFGLKIQYHNRHKLSDHDAAGARYVSFEELLRTSDILSLNLPLNPNTRHIIAKTEFDQMKEGVVIVNTARGAVIDESALVEALDSGKVSSAGLDVFEEEPRIHPGLIKNLKCILLPHQGTSTWETLNKMEKSCVDNVHSAITTGRLINPVPEQKNLDSAH